MPKVRAAFAVVLIFIIGAVALFAQSSPSASQNDQEPADTLKVSVNVVQLFFNVKDKKGGLIPNLTKDQFQIAEDGKPQTIKYFAAESNLPLTLGILIDTSPSQRQVLEMEKEVGGQFLDQVLREKDLAFVLGFDVDVNLLQDFTSSTRLLKKAMNGTRIGGGGSMSPGMGGGPVPTLSQACCTMLYDAVYLASHDQLAQQVGRKAMILLTDGEDEGSKVKIQEAIEAAQKSDSICYVILIADRGGWQGFGGGEMNKLAKETGGRVIEVGNKFDKLKEGFAQIANELRSQYSVGYTPVNDKLDGTFRKIQIQANNKDYKIQARSGYYAVPKQD